MSGVAEFERSLIRKRCQSGIDRAKAEGKQFGHKPKLDVGQRSQIAERYASGETMAELRPATASPSRRSGARCNSSVTIPVYSVTGPLAPPAEP